MSRKSPQQKAKEKLDTIFSQFIRLRDSDDEGYAKCISCPKTGFWYNDKIQNGHYIPRNILKSRFAELNCNAQCVGCNLFKEPKEMQFCYREGLIKKIGLEAVIKLEQERHQIFKVDVHWYNEQIRHYTEEVNRLKQEKGI